MKNEKDLEMKYLTIKLSDINKYMTDNERKVFWELFWRMVDTREEKIYPELYRK